MQTTYLQITSVCGKTSAQGRVLIIKYSAVIVVDLQQRNMSVNEQTC